MIDEAVVSMIERNRQATELGKVAHEAYVRDLERADAHRLAVREAIAREHACLLTKREAFAAAALTGILATRVPTERFAPEPLDPYRTAERAVSYADALLAELAKGGPKP